MGDSNLTRKMREENTTDTSESRHFCTLCEETFTSLHALHFHRRQHEPHCENCWIKFKSFAEVYKHQPYCAYKTDCIRVRPLSESSRPSGKVSKKRLKETCEFCDEKFDKEEINEHINSCTKRVSSAKWVLKYRKSKIKTHDQ